MGPAQCLPTEWPGSASVRPGGTGPDVALSLSRAVTIRQTSGNNSIFKLHTPRSKFTLTTPSPFFYVGGNVM